MGEPYGRFVILTDEHVSWALVSALPANAVVRFIEALTCEEDPFVAGVRHIKP